MQIYVILSTIPIIMDTDFKFSVLSQIWAESTSECNITKYF